MFRGKFLNLIDPVVEVNVGNLEKSRLSRFDNRIRFLSWDYEAPANGRYNLIFLIQIVRFSFLRQIGGGEVDLLFPNHVEIEKDYFKRTGIHPIMHLVAIRKEVYEKNPWIAKPLYKAFVEAKNRAWAEYHNTGANRSMFPWVWDHVAETEKVMGRDPWPYGVEANRATLESLVRNLRRQGMINREPKLEEIFVPVD